MTSIRKALAEDFEKVYPLFHGFRAPRPDKETFRQLFVRRWDSREEHFGYILEEAGRPVGFLGALHSTRVIKGRIEKFCNMSCWIVQEQHRSEGLSLLFHLLQEKDTTFTNFTGVKVAPILTRFKFQPLDASARILLPFPTRIAFREPGRVLLGADRIAPHLAEPDRRILEDHRPFRYPHALFLGKSSYSYLVTSKIYLKGLPVAKVHHLSHPDVFCRLAPALLPQFCLGAGVIGLLVGDHYLRDLSVHTAAVTFPHQLPYLVRSSSVSLEEMDTLYSELQVLNL
jgi:hypothetical protein